MTATNTEQQKKPAPAPDDAGPQAKARAPFTTEDEAPITDEEARRDAITQLSEHLALSTELLSWCERMTGVPKGPRMEAVNSASRLMNATAHEARALADLARVERRKRTIVEHIEPARPVSIDSNSDPVGRELDALSETLARYMNVYANEKFGTALAEAEPNAAAQTNPAAATAAAPSGA